MHADLSKFCCVDARARPDVTQHTYVHVPTYLTLTWPVHFIIAVYIYTSMYLYMYMYMYVCTCIYVSSLENTELHTDMYIGEHVYVHVHEYIYLLFQFS